MVRLGDVATYINGYAFKPSDWSDTGLPIIRIQDLSGNSYQANRYNGEYSPKYEVNDGDVLISWSASLGVYVWHGEKALLNQHIFKVVFDKISISKEFFVYQVENILEKASSEAHGATMKHLTKPVFDALPFYLPPFDEQHKIAAVLDKLSDLMDKRRQQMSKLDEIVKSRFIEMFGDPENNNKAWPVKSLDKLCTVGSSKRVYQSEQSSEGVPFWRISDLVSKIDTGTVDSALFISEIKYTELKRAGLVPVTGDILVTSRGTLGRCYIIQDEDRFYFQDGMISWLSNYSEEIMPLYLQYLFTMSGFRKQIDNMQAGSTVAYLSIAMLKKLQVMVPDKELQEQFAVFVETTDKSKYRQEKCIGFLRCLEKNIRREWL